MRPNESDERRIRELLKEHGILKTVKLSGFTRYYVERLAWKMKQDNERSDPRIPHKPAELTPAETIELDKRIRKATSAEVAAKAKYDYLLEQHELATKQLEAHAALKAGHRVVNIKRHSEKASEAVPFIIASDWHCGAIVRPNTVSWLNEFNDQIFEERAHKFFVNAVTLIKKEAVAVKIRRAVLALLGDFIENSIHEELIEEQTLSPIQQMVLAQNTLSAGIEYLLKETDLDEIVIPTAPGNHGRLTDRMRPATNWKNSFEILMYRQLAKLFENEKRVKFVISDSYWNYLEVFDKTVGFHHGDAVKFNGGIGGLTIPLIKFLHRAQDQRRFDFSFCGHFHSNEHGFNFMVNNCLVGPTAYGLKFGFPPTKPTQIFQLLDADRGWTVYAPIQLTSKTK